MPENRYYIETSLEQGASVPLLGEELRHLRVMRKTVGDSLELVNGKNELAECRLEILDRKSAHIRIEKVHHSAENGAKLILVQALTKPSLLEWIVEKGTELGASDFWLFPAERSGKKELSNEQRRRLRLITIAALKQCGRLDLPSIIEKPILSKWGALSGQKFFGDLKEEAPHFAKLEMTRGDLLFFIGPEAGFSTQEIALLEGPLQARGVKLHKNILRTETAALVALSIASLK